MWQKSKRTKKQRKADQERAARVRLLKDTSPRGKGRNLLRRELEKMGKIRSHTLETLFVGFSDHPLLQSLWLDGLHRQVWLYLQGAAKAEFGFRAKLESVRLVIGGYPAHTATSDPKSLGGLLDTQSYKDVISEELIDGFMLRILVPTRK
jgi:hypothetical protein